MGEELKYEREDNIKTLIKEPDEAQTRRETVEKTTSEKMKELCDDIKAMESRLHKEEKEFPSEKMTKVNDLKVEQSSLVTVKDVAIDSLNFEIDRLTSHLIRTQNDLRQIETWISAPMSNSPRTVERSSPMPIGILSR
jgi:hypothetical protein